MDIHTAAKYAWQGYRIRRARWEPDEWISEDSIRRHPTTFTMYDLLADDWEIITEGIIKEFPDIEYSD